ncbi:MAG: hypothetical protein JWO28_3185, partial [Hyphomicrobiales bacterium]|nr:hypothetical protein [Hyphomicrobiales bacterium]
MHNKKENHFSSVPHPVGAAGGIRSECGWSRLCNRERPMLTKSIFAAALL